MYKQRSTPLILCLKESARVLEGNNTSYIYTYITVDIFFQVLRLSKKMSIKQEYL